MLDLKNLLNDDFVEACVEGLTADQFNRIALLKIASEISNTGNVDDIFKTASYLEKGTVPYAGSVFDLFKTERTDGRA